MKIKITVENFEQALKKIRDMSKSDSELDLSWSQLDQLSKYQAKELIESIPSHVTALNMQSCSLSLCKKETLYYLFAAIKETITSLNIGSNSLAYNRDGNRGGEKLSITLGALHDRIQELDMGNNYLWHLSGDSLKTVMERVPRSVKILHLQDNNLCYMITRKRQPIDWLKDSFEELPCTLRTLNFLDIPDMMRHCDKREDVLRLLSVIPESVGSLVVRPEEFCNGYLSAEWSKGKDCYFQALWDLLKATGKDIIVDERDFLAKEFQDSCMESSTVLGCDIALQSDNAGTATLFAQGFFKLPRELKQAILRDVSTDTQQAAEANRTFENR